MQTFVPAPTPAAAPAAPATKDPRTWLRGSKGLVATARLVGDLSLKVGDQLMLQASDGAAYVYTVAAADTVQTLVTGINASAATSKLAAALDPFSRLVVYTTTGSSLTVVAASTPAAFPALLGQTDQVGAIVSLTCAATEADVRAKTLLAIELSRATSMPVVVDIPAGEIAFASAFALFNRDGSRVLLRGAPATRKTLTGVVSVTAAGTNAYDVVVSVSDSSPWSVGQRCWLQYLGMVQSTTVASGVNWANLIGSWTVTAKPAANQLTLRVISRTSPASAVGVAVSGSPSLSIAAVLQPTTLVFPAGSGGLLLWDSPLNLTRLNLFGQDGVNAALVANGDGLAVLGPRSVVCCGAVAVTGFGSSGAVVAWSGTLALGELSPSDVADGSENPHAAFSGCSMYGIWAASPGSRWSANGSSALGGGIANVALSASGNGFGGAAAEGADANSRLLRGIVAGGNSGCGVVIYRGGRAKLVLPELTVLGNTATSVFAFEQAFIDMLGGNASITVSPSPGSVANNNSFITR